MNCLLAIDLPNGFTHWHALRLLAFPTLYLSLIAYSLWPVFRRRKEGGLGTKGRAVVAVALVELLVLGFAVREQTNFLTNMLPVREIDTDANYVGSSNVPWVHLFFLTLFARTLITSLLILVTARKRPILAVPGVGLLLATALWLFPAAWMMTFHEDGPNSSLVHGHWFGEDCPSAHGEWCDYHHSFFGMHRFPFDRLDGNRRVRAAKTRVARPAITPDSTPNSTPPQSWGPDTYVDLDQVPESLTRGQPFRRMPTWTEFAEMEATGIFRLDQVHFGNRRSSRLSNDRFRKILGLGECSDEELTSLRSRWWNDQNEVLDMAELAMQGHTASLVNTATFWLYIAPVYAPRPQPPIREDGTFGGEGMYWEFCIVEEGGWHGYWLWDSQDFNDVESLLKEAFAFRVSERLHAKREFQ